MDGLIEKVKAYIERFSMLHRGDRVLVGVSGGADSMCLLSVLEELAEEYHMKLYVLHVHHGLRGNEADGDEAYVQEYCGKHSISFFAEHFDIGREAEKNGWSLEEAGRIMRYRAFELWADREQCHKIAVAHHQQDMAETVLFQLFRGTGLTGLCGIPPVRGRIIRPLLCIGREEIEDYLGRKELAYRTDSSNLSLEFSRNKIRNQLLPYITRELNTQAVRHIAELAGQMREYKELLDENTAGVYQEMVQEEKGWLCVKCTAFLSLPAVLQREVLLRAIRQLCGGEGGQDITYRQLEAAAELAKNQAGRSLILSNGIRVVKSYETLELSCSPQEAGDLLSGTVWIEKSRLPFCYSLPEKKDLPCSGYRLHIFMEDYKNSMKIPKNRYTKWFDYDKIGNTLELRTRKQGDIIQIGRDGTCKSLNRLLIDCKIPRGVRDGYPLLACGNEILLVPGLRSGEGYQVTEDTTRVLVIRIEPPED